MTRTTGFDDTIAALATPLGRGAVALIRISGPAAVKVIDALVDNGREAGWSDRRQTLVRLTHPQSRRPLDQALVTVFRAPASYTGEDVVEISTHGGQLTPQLVLDALFAAGARAALPGEFTRRALLNGKLDLLQAEAIVDLIDGRSPAMHDAALHQMERGLSRRIEELRASILRLEALVSYSIDFPEEDEPPTPPERVLEEAAAAVGLVSRLLATVPQGRLLREGALVVFAGRPNSGKSSLFNALLGLDRSIVTEIPGTTRDAIEADALLGGFPFRLVDTAGLRRTEDRVEAIGIEVARRYLASADILLYCAPLGEPLEDEELEFVRGSGAQHTILVRTKADLVQPATRDAEGWAGVRPQEAGDGEAGREGSPEPEKDGGPDTVVTASVVTREGLDQLRDAIVGATFGGIVRARTGDEAPLVTSERQRRALEKARAELEAFIAAMSEDVPMELAAVHLREAGGALEDLIGLVTTEDVLDTLFSRFCVGK